MVHLIVSNFHNGHAILLKHRFKKTLTSVKTWNKKLFKNSAFQEKKGLIAGTSTILNTLVKHLFLDSRGKVK